MRIHVDRSSAQPVYRQIEGEIGRTVRQGALGPGERLPSARELASDLGVSRLTVEAAYSALEVGGLLERRPGSGTFVLPSAGGEAPRAADPAGPWPLWQRELEDAGAPQPRQARAPFDFGGGTGARESLPSAEFGRVLRDVIRREGERIFDYEDPQGFEPLRRSIAQVLCSQGLGATANRILVTSGSQQAISLVARLLLREGDTVLVEEPSYGAALRLFRAEGLRIVGVPVDRDGMRVEEMEPLLQRHRPGLLYCTPNFQNPTGTCLSAPRRLRLVELAVRYNLPVLEDDYVGDLRYDGRALPCLKALDRSGAVIYVSTFSKMLMPGLRIGFILADGPVLALLTDRKRTTDLSSASLPQRVLCAYLSVGRYRRHLRRCRALYRGRRDAMAAGIRRWFPAGTSFAVPAGGLFLWARLPGGLRCRDIARGAAEAGVAFRPGRESFVGEAGGDRWMRLNFAANDVPVIEEGMRRLGLCVRAARRAAA